jgi:hypothetical protein
LEGGRIGGGEELIAKREGEGKGTPFGWDRERRLKNGWKRNGRKNKDLKTHPPTRNQVPIVVVALKTDMESKREVSKERGAAFAAKFGAAHFEISSKKGSLSEIGVPWLELIARTIFWQETRTNLQFSIFQPNRDYYKELKSEFIFANPLAGIAFLKLANDHNAIWRFSFSVPEEIFVMIGLYILLSTNEVLQKNALL